MKQVQFPDPDVRPLDIATEIQTLERNYSAIAKNVDKFVLIQGKEIVGYFDSYAQATGEGYKRCGLGNFLARKIKKDEAPIRAMRFGVERLGSFVPTIGKRRKA